MKLDSIMTIVGVLSLVGRMHATMVVHDPVLMAKQSADEVVNFAKWAKTEVDAAQTQLNTLQTYENTVLQVVRMGNPAALRNLPVVASIAALAGTGQQLLADYQRIRAMANPQYLQGQLGSVVNAYQLQNWTPLAPGAYQFAAANWQVSQTVQDQMLTSRNNARRSSRSGTACSRVSRALSRNRTSRSTALRLRASTGGLAEVAARASELAQKSQL